MKINNLRFCLLFVGVIFILTIIPLVSSVTIGLGTIMNTTFSNSSISFDTIPVIVDEFKIEVNSVELYNASWTNGDLTAVATTTINWSTANSNLKSSQFPRISSSTNNGREKVFSSSLTHSISGTFSFAINDKCEEINKITYGSTTYEGQAARLLCSSERITLTSVPSGNTDFEYEPGTSKLASLSLQTLIGLVALVILLFAVGGFMYYAKDNFSSVSTMDFIKWAIGLLLVTVLMIVLINYIASVS